MAIFNSYVKLPEGSIRVHVGIEEFWGRIEEFNGERDGEINGEIKE